MIELYEHQAKLVSDISINMREHKHIIAYAPCGFGKSFVICDIAKRCLDKGKKVLILSHRLVLLRQNNESLQEYGLGEMQVINDKLDLDFSKKLYCSSLQTLQARLKKEEYHSFVSSFNLVLIDECHTQFSNYLFESGLLSQVYVVGFTGSPVRNGNQRQLGLDYTTIVLSKTVKELVRMNKLVQCRYFEVPADISGIKIDNATGDFQAKSAYQKFDNPERYDGVTSNYLMHGENRDFVCFCCNVAHAIKTCMQFVANGIKTKYVVSNITAPREPVIKEGAVWERYLDKKETYDLHQRYKAYSLHQSKVNDAFDNGEINGIVCIEILSTGWDRKKLSCCILNRATQSVSLYLQMLGRIERPYPNKTDAIVLDLGTNKQRLGSAEDDREWDIWHEMSDSVGLPAKKVCGEKGQDKKGKQGCNMPILASLSICPYCGYIFATEKEIREVELIEILEEEASEWSGMSVEGLFAYAELKGYKKLWVFRQIYNSKILDFKSEMKAMGYKWSYLNRLIEQYEKTTK